MRKVNSRGRLSSKLLSCFMSVVLAVGVMVPGTLTAYAQENSLSIAGASLESAVDVSGNETLRVQSANGPATSIVIAGTTVNGSNPDIFGDGTASFDASTGTLTLRNFATTGNNAGDYTLIVREGNLTLELHGNNTFVAGTNAHGVWVWNDLTITGDGNLSATGGNISTATAAGICVDGAFTISASYSGTIVATGGNSAATADGVFCAGGLNIHGGTLVATGGYIGNNAISAGIEVTRPAERGLALTLDGGTLIVQGGNSGGYSYGIYGDENYCSFQDGVAVIRAGLYNGDLSVTARRALFSKTTRQVDAENEKVVGEESYGLVILPKSYQVVGDFSSLPATLSNDVYHVSTEKANFGANLTAENGSLDLNGHRAVFVDLYEGNSSSDVQAGVVLNASSSYELTGNGELVSVGGIAVGSDSASKGLYASCPLTINGPKVTCVASQGFSTFGSHVNGTVNVENGDFVGVGGPAYKSLASSSKSSGIKGALSARNSSIVLGVGGKAFASGSSGNNTSFGIEGGADTYDKATVMGVGGMVSDGFNSTKSVGITDASTARGGVVLGVGGYAQNFSFGCGSDMVSHEGGKIVGLGGIGGSGDSYKSYGCGTAPCASNGGEQLIAGRTMPYAYTEADKDKKYVACDADDEANAYSDFYGTQGKTPVNYDTTQETISTFKCIEINKTAPAPITVARPVGVNFTYDSTSHAGVAQGEGYTLTGASTAVDANVYTVTANLKNGYVWDNNTYTPQLITWTISPALITSVSAASQIYTGSALRPTPAVKAGNLTVPASGYNVVSYAANTGVGIATVVVSGKGNFIGVKSGTFTISKASLAGKAISLSASSFSYDGSVHKPAVTGVGGVALKEGTDFSVSYSNSESVNAGNYTVTAVGMGNYTGSSIAATYAIAKAGISASAKKASVTLKAKDLKKKKKTVANLNVENGQGKVTYKNVSKKKAVKKFKVKKGKLVVPKGTKKGTYAVKVKVITAGGANYDPGTATVSFKVKVK